MIAVDIFADLYDWDDKQRARTQRVMNTGKAVFNVARGGAAGPLIFVEAALAVVDAAGAYARYRQAKEVTRQLEIESEALLHALAELDKQLAIRAKVDEMALEAQASALRMRLQQQQREIEISAATFASIARQVKALGEAIARLRMSAPPGCRSLLRLESTYYDLVDVQLRTAMALIQE